MDPDLFNIQWVTLAEIKTHTKLKEAFEYLCDKTRRKKSGVFVEHGERYVYMIPSPNNTRDNVLECKICKNLMSSENFAYHTCSFTKTLRSDLKAYEDQCGIITSGVVVHPAEDPTLLKKKCIGAPLWPMTTSQNNATARLKDQRLTDTYRIVGQGRAVGIYAGEGPYIEESSKSVPVSSVIVLLLQSR